jgi:hypothetical protein
VTADKVQFYEGICLIIEAEGPMLAKKVYDIYLRRCGIKKLESQLKKIMNSAMQYAINNNQIETEDERGKGGIIYSIVRIKDSAPIKLKNLGSRLFDEIPPSELQTVSILLKKENMELGGEENLRDVLNDYGLKRLTPSVKKSYKEANRVRFAYVDKYFKQNKSFVPSPSKSSVNVSKNVEKTLDGPSRYFPPKS